MWKKRKPSVMALRPSHTRHLNYGNYYRMILLYYISNIHWISKWGPDNFPCCLCKTYLKTLAILTSQIPSAWHKHDMSNYYFNLYFHCRVSLFSFFFLYGQWNLGMSQHTHGLTNMGAWQSVSRFRGFIVQLLCEKRPVVTMMQ